MQQTLRHLFNEDEPHVARFVTERRLLSLLEISRTTLWRLRREGLPTLRFGRSVRYDIQKVKAWLEKNGEAEAVSVSSPAEPVIDTIAECHWSLAVALDPKHRPQEPSKPASTVRREWWRFPQEAHLLDRTAGRYRRLVAREIALIQGFPEDWARESVQDELLLIRGYGDAVPPPLSEAVFSELPSLLSQGPS